MRAWDLLIFLTAFNAAMYVMDAIGIFGAATPGGRIIDLPSSLAIGVVAAGILAGSITVLGTRVTQPIGVVAVAFTAFYVVMLTQAMGILYEFRMGTTQLVPAPILALIVAFNGIIFAAALIQMVTGGWRGYR